MQIRPGVEIKLQNKIKKLKEKKKAILLVHNYQRDEIQEIADYLGDSLGLALQAAKTEADTIVFCGVKFMAETAKILSPSKKILLPEIDAGCPMANMVTAKDIIKLKNKYPEAKVVSYINTNAEVKAVSDVCCTSSNAVQVVKNIDTDKIIFTPDKHLGHWIQRFVDKKMIIWDGYCYVHSRITPEEVKAAKKNIPDAPLIVHPECRKEVIDLADKVGSTGDMVKFTRESDAKRIIIGTEAGLINRLKRENPNKEFFAAGTPKICQNMKKITLESVYHSLYKSQYEINLSDEIIQTAKNALKLMLEYS